MPNIAPIRYLIALARNELGTAVCNAASEALDALCVDNDRLQAELAERDATLRSIACQTACRCGPEWTRYGCHAPGCRFEISLEAMEALGEDSSTGGGPNDDRN